MKRNDSIEQLKYLIDRYDRFLQVIDIKGNLLLAYHFFLIGGLLLNYSDIKFIYPSGLISFDLLLTFVIPTTLISVFLIFSSIYPFLKRGNSKKSSLIYFKDISSMNYKDFKEGFENQNKDDLEKDLIQQAYVISKGLTSKFNKIRWAGIFCYIHLLLATIVIIQYIIYETF